jgi:pyridoxal/pyridoxine/pyridoxamine kinase
MQTVHQPPSADTITVDQLEAERLTGVSHKSLERATKAGEATGRIKVGRRVLFVRDVLEAWIKSKLTTTN